MTDKGETANMLCKLLGHKFVYLTKAGPYGHRFYCQRCLAVREFHVQRQIAAAVLGAGVIDASKVTVRNGSLNLMPEPEPHGVVSEPE